MSGDPDLAGFLPVYASAVEGAALADLGAVQLGVGKVAAATSMTEQLLRAPRRGVLLFGIGGAYPARHCPGAHLQILDLCLIASDRLGDEGVASPQGFSAIENFLSQPAASFRTADFSAGLAERLALPLVDAVTVSTCSGSEASSATMCRRSGAMVETMEGAAVAFVCMRYGVPLAHMRSISNFTGDRNRSEWSLTDSVAVVQAAVRRLLGD